MAKVVISFRQLNNILIVVAAMHIHQRLLGNPNFEALQDRLEQLLLLATRQSELNEKVKGGSKDDIHARRDNKIELENLLNELGRIINGMTTDRSILETTGFDIVKAPTPITELPKPEEFSAKSTGNKGEVVLKCKGNKNAKFYEFYYAVANEANELTWNSISSSSCKLSLNNLTSGATYFFKCAYRGNQTKVNYSDVITKDIY